jgi:hypothetical protein
MRIIVTGGNSGVGQATAAGVLGLPLTGTADGFEAHMGTNHLASGHTRRIRA